MNPEDELTPFDYTTYKLNSIDYFGLKYLDIILMLALIIFVVLCFKWYYIILLPILLFIIGRIYIKKIPVSNQIKNCNCKSIKILGSNSNISFEIQDKNNNTAIINSNNIQDINIEIYELWHNAYDWFYHLKTKIGKVNIQTLDNNYCLFISDIDIFKRSLSSAGIKVKTDKVEIMYTL